MWAQDQKEPEAADQFYFFVSAGQFKPLEHQSPVGRRVEGNRSTVRFVQGEPLAFVVRLRSDTANPASAVQFLKLKPQGNSRVQYGGTVPFQAANFEESSLKIKPKGQLDAGEYALSVAGRKDVYCFAVDAPSKTLK